MFNYNVNVKIIPTELKRGKRAKIIAVISNPTKEIDYCVGGIRGYNMQQKLEPSNNNTFNLTLGVPFIAPRGNYLVEVYAVSKDGEKGPVFQTETEVI